MTPAKVRAAAAGEDLLPAWIQLPITVTAERDS
jgi:hypothetical protein